MTDTKTAASLFDMFKTSEEAETQGIWVPVGPARFKLARMGGENRNFQKEATKRLKPFQASIDSLPDAVARKLSIELFVDTVLIGWENVVWSDGQPFEFSKENAVKLFLELPNLFIALQQEALKMSNFSAANLEAAAGN